MKTANVLRSKKGMTLMELVVTLMVLSILIAVVTTCVFSTMGQYAWAKSSADMTAVVSVIDGTVERELSLSSGVTLISSNSIAYFKNGTLSQTMETKAEDGENSILYIGGAPALDIAFYKDVSVSAQFELLDGAVLVTLTYSGVDTYVSTFVVDAISS